MLTAVTHLGGSHERTGSRGSASLTLYTRSRGVKKAKPPYHRILVGPPHRRASPGIWRRLKYHRDCELDHAFDKPRPASWRRLVGATKCVRRHGGRIA